MSKVKKKFFIALSKLFQYSLDKYRNGLNSAFTPTVDGCVETSEKYSM